MHAHTRTHTQLHVAGNMVALLEKEKSGVMMGESSRLLVAFYLSSYLSIYLSIFISIYLSIYRILSLSVVNPPYPAMKWSDRPVLVRIV
jgi:hypothetical protein